MQMSDE